MDLVVEKEAAKVLRRLQPTLALAILKKMEAIAANPLARHANIETLQGLKNGFRLRQGDWRVIYEIDTAMNVVRITKIGPRGQVYK
ncbi:MAG TPA: type II toxin-antitoxin system RelE/ParE family toxin [Rhizomicrobium sp.]|jgi:mRNA interferase RelE/StbE|nr:type II toxin-antitoxin system RelE/ParE family toxin [Rhizomicrobium sp.]